MAEIQKQPCINPKITTKFSWSNSYSNQSSFNQPLFLIGSFLKEQTLKEFNNDYADTDKEIYFNKLKCDLKNEDIEFEMTTYCKNSETSDTSDTINTISDENDFENSKIIKSNKLYKNDISKNYLLDHLNLDKEIEFYYDGAKFSLKVDKVLDKNAIIIQRENAYLFSTYTITCDKKDFAKFDSFITTSIKFYLQFYDDDIKQEENKIKLFISTDDGYFQTLGLRNKRDIDTIYLPSKQKKVIIDDLNYFLDSKTVKKYKQLGITHKRTYLFEGVPGSGKSSFIMGLASYFGYNIAIVTFSPKMTDNCLIRLLRILEDKEEKKIFIIFEDMDCIFKERKANDESRNQITFSGILNALDGITTRDNMICFITTNYKQHLDSALIRPGRVDHIMKFDYVCKEQVLKIFTVFTECAEKAKDFYEDLTRFNINISVSLLQQYLLKYINKPDEAIDNLDKLKKMYDDSHINKEAGETGLYN